MSRFSSANWSGSEGRQHQSYIAPESPSRYGVECAAPNCTGSLTKFGARKAKCSEGVHVFTAKQLQALGIDFRSVPSIP